MVTVNTQTASMNPSYSSRQKPRYALRCRLCCRVLRVLGNGRDAKGPAVDLPCFQHNIPYTHCVTLCLNPVEPYHVLQCSEAELGNLREMMAELRKAMALAITCSCLPFSAMFPNPRSSPHDTICRLLSQVRDPGRRTSSKSKRIRRL